MPGTLDGQQINPTNPFAAVLDDLPQTATAVDELLDALVDLARLQSHRAGARVAANFASGFEEHQVNQVTADATAVAGAQLCVVAAMLQPSCDQAQDRLNWVDNMTDAIRTGWLSGIRGDQPTAGRLVEPIDMPSLDDDAIGFDVPGHIDVALPVQTVDVRRDLL